MSNKTKWVPQGGEREPELSSERVLRGSLTHRVQCARVANDLLMPLCPGHLQYLTGKQLHPKKQAHEAGRVVTEF